MNSPVTFSPPDAPDTPRPPEPGVRATQILALVTAVMLIVLCVAWESVLAPTGRGTLVLKALPLALALPGLWRERLYTYRWLSLALWLYAAEGALRIGLETPLVSRLAAAELVLSLVMFTACAVHVRQRLAAGRRLAAAEATRGQEAPT